MDKIDLIFLNILKSALKGEKRTGCDFLTEEISHLANRKDKQIFTAVQKTYRRRLHADCCKGLGFAPTLSQPGFENVIRRGYFGRAAAI